MCIRDRDITVGITPDGVFINNAQVTVADITTDNGVVHVIDAVLLPELTAVKNIDEFKAINIFPNPVSDFLNIELNEAFENPINIKLLNNNGVLVKEWRNVRENQQISTSGMNNGMYFIELSNEGQRYYKKLILSN